MTGFMKPILVAEAATNHNGDMGLALEMIDAAKEAGADYIKFQSWRTETMETSNPAYEMMRKKELSNDDHFQLIQRCRDKKIGFLTTCFDIGRVDFLSTLGINTIKIASTDVTSIRMLKKLRDKFDHLVLSTGMSRPDEVKEAVKVIDKGYFTLLHCVSLYPTSPEKANLGRMKWLKQFSKNVGYSDHTVGNEACKTAVAMGATFVEKHFTLKHDPENVFSIISALPKDIKEISQWIDSVNTLIGNDKGDMNEEENESRLTFIGRWGNNK